MSDKPQTPGDHRLYRPSQADKVLQNQPQHVTWRLNMREDPDDRGMCLPEDFDNRHGKATQRRLISYIAAGGMRDLQPSHTAEAEEHNRLGVIIFSAALLVFWLLFFFLPCR